MVELKWQYLKRFSSSLMYYDFASISTFIISCNDGYSLVNPVIVNV